MNNLKTFWVHEEDDLGGDYKAVVASRKHDNRQFNYSSIADGFLENLQRYFSCLLGIGGYLK